MTPSTDDAAMAAGRPDLAAYEIAFRRLFAAVDERCGEGVPWLSRAAGALGAVVELFAADPALARTVMVESIAAGPEARKLYEDAIDRLAGQLDPGDELAADRELPEQISLMAVGAVSGLIFKDVLAGRAEALPARLPDLLFTMLVPYLGPQEAANEMRKAAADQRGA